MLLGHLPMCLDPHFFLNKLTDQFEVMLLSVLLPLKLSNFVLELVYPLDMDHASALDPVVVKIILLLGQRLVLLLLTRPLFGHPGL